MNQRITLAKRILALAAIMFCITTVDGTIIDGYLKAIPPFTPEYQLTRFVLHDRDLCLGQLRILSLNPKHGTAILQPHIRSLTVTRQTKQPTNERNPQ